MIRDLVEFRDVQAHVAGLDDAELSQELRDCEARVREEAARQAALLAECVANALRDAASKPPGSKAPRPTSNVHIDHDSFRDIALEAGLLPERDVDPFDDPIPHVTDRFCRTTNGDVVDQRTVLQLLLSGYVRWVIHDDEGEIIHWGRAERLFEGAARDAVRSLSTRCTAPGCRVPTTRTDTEHRTEYARGGRTDPDDGNPACKRHNLIRHNRRFTVTRDKLGNWHTYRPDGTEVQSSDPPWKTSASRCVLP